MVRVLQNVFRLVLFYLSELLLFVAFEILQVGFLDFLDFILNVEQIVPMSHYLL